MSDRYHVIATLLDDPRNYAIVLREMYRREQAGKNLVPPPSKNKGVLCFPTQESYSSKKTIREFHESQAEIRKITDGTWWLFLGNLSDMDDNKVGPFGSEKETLEEALRYFSELEDTIHLDEDPWDKNDLEEYK